MIGWDVLAGTFDATDFVLSPLGAGPKKRILCISH
jgi:hypothetical protein